MDGYREIAAAATTVGDAYTIAQPILNFIFGAIVGLIGAKMRVFAPGWLLWPLLLVFVSVRIIGDYFFQISEPAYEPIRLYVYATSFFLGVLIGRSVFRLFFYPHED